jgi:hypothetical protein
MVARTVSDQRRDRLHLEADGRVKDQEEPPGSGEFNVRKAVAGNVAGSRAGEIE